MIKTLAAANRSERERFKVPRSVQQSIPVQRIFRDGIWQSGTKFTQTWRFADINYSLASHDDQMDMFRSYCAVLNSLPTDATSTISLNASIEAGSLLTHRASVWDYRLLNLSWKNRAEQSPSRARPTWELLSPSYSLHSPTPVQKPRILTACLTRLPPYKIVR